jgi:hypothetical protein
LRRAIRWKSKLTPPPDVISSRSSRQSSNRGCLNALNQLRKPGNVAIQFGQQQRSGFPPKPLFGLLRYPDTKARGLRVPRFLFRYAIALPMSAKGMKGRWVVYERRDGEFIFLSRLLTARAQPAFYDGAIFPNRPMNARLSIECARAPMEFQLKQRQSPKLNWMTSIK